jgi:DNA-binding MarR family transcriptional regulator/GNAT superfamily N-acetyltransferase
MVDAAMSEGEIASIREVSRQLVRELGFMRATLAGTSLSPSAVHAIVEIGTKGVLRAAELCDTLALEKSTVSRLVRRLVEGGELAEAVSDRDGRVKQLTLTKRGEATLAAIERFARSQVVDALAGSSQIARDAVREGLALYAGALRARRTGRSDGENSGISIRQGYHPGVIGRAVDMHARHYGRTAGFGRFFERRVAAELAEFAGRLDRTGNGLWVALHHGAVVGTVAIDGEDLGHGIAHLRWFIVDDAQRGAGIGRALLAQAMEFCDRHGFAETHLWTFRGLEAARRLYESHGFALVHESQGNQGGAEVIEQKYVRRAGSGPVTTSGR